MTSDFKIQFLTTAQTLPLRRSALKPHLSEQECINPGDELSTTYHLGLVCDSKIVCVASFMKDSFPELPAKNSYRLRGMATDKNFQGKGCGRELLNYGLEYLRTEHNCDLVWCNAREIAFTFYEKIGFYFHGPLFDIRDTGPHKVMYKRLIPR